MFDEREKLKKIIDLGLEMTEIKDLDLLLERILTEARRFTDADAGSIYVREDNKLKFSNTQNETLRKKLAPDKKLLFSTFLLPIDDKSIAGHVALKGETLNIPDVYKMNPGVPYTFNKSFDEVSNYKTTSMLVCPLKNQRGDVIGVLQLINARDVAGKVKPFDKNDEPYITHFANSAAIAIERAQMTRAIILRMIKMAELRDPKETGAHVNRVAAYSVEIYERWAMMRGIPSEEIMKNKDILRMAAMLHDAGKVAISDTILKKPAKLDYEEFEIMKHHTFLGARLFSDLYSEFDDASFIVALNHHEKWDGNGYPGHINALTGKPIPGYETGSGTAQGKKGEEIPPFGRIVAIADVYDALCSRRVYKEAWDESRVLETLRHEADKQFDPDMIAVFFLIYDIIRNVAERYPEQ